MVGPRRIVLIFVLLVIEQTQVEEWQHQLIRQKTVTRHLAAAHLEVGELNYGVTAKGPDVSITISDDGLYSILELFNGKYFINFILNTVEMLKPLTGTIRTIPSLLIEVADGAISADSAIMEAKTKLYEALVSSGENTVNQILKASIGWEMVDAMSAIGLAFEQIQKMMGSLHKNFNISDIITKVSNISESLGYEGINISSVFSGHNFFNPAIRTPEDVGSTGNITTSTITNAMRKAINAIDRITERLHNRYSE